jgi:hypothetical protein
MTDDYEKRFTWFPRVAWEPSSPALRAVSHSAARRNCIPTQRVGWIRRQP